MGPNTLRALASDLAYLEAWSLAATGWPLPWPASETLVLKFIAHHLWDPAQREADPRHGMPDDGGAVTASPGHPAGFRSSCSLDREAAAGALGHPSSLAWPRGALHLPSPACGPSAGGPRLRSSSDAKEPPSGHA
jgi:hypothetical protein